MLALPLLLAPGLLVLALLAPPPPPGTLVLVLALLPAAGVGVGAAAAAAAAGLALAPALAGRSLISTSPAGTLYSVYQGGNRTLAADTGQNLS
jgi:hypothetical protein